MILKKGVLFNKDYTPSVAISKKSSRTYKIPKDGTMIGKSAFSCCSSLTSANIPNSVTFTGVDIFSSCTNLTSATIGDNLNKISDGTFSNCINLASVSLGKNVNTIEPGAFSGCSKISKIWFFNTNPPVCDKNTIYDISKYNCTLYVSTGSKNAYLEDPGWSDFFNIEEFDPSGIETVNNNPVKVVAQNGKVVIAGTENNEVIDIYRVNGQRVYTGTNNIIYISASGLYIVKVAGKDYKVII